MPRFNDICAILAVSWLSFSIPTGILLRPTIDDFSQFYMGGTMASLGKWDALYPIPWNSQDNAGLHSYAKLDWILLSVKRGAPNYTHFILPPPSALLFTPLSRLTYMEAFWAWTILLSGCVLGVALISAGLLREILGRPSRWEGFLILLIVLSPMTARSIRIANVSPLIALSIAVTLRSLLRDHPLRGAGAIVLGTLLKYATLILAPLLLVMRRWRMLAWSVALGALALGITVFLAGTEPFTEFLRVILPTLSRPSAYPGNQTLPGLLVRLLGRPLSYPVASALGTFRVVSLTAVIYVLFQVWPRNKQNPVNVLAASAMLISWLLIFSPVAWEHWAIFLCPVWGWLLWEIMQSGVRRVYAVASLGLMYFPAGIIQVKGIASYPVAIPEPLNSSQLIGVLLLFGLSYWRLTEPRTSSKPFSLQEIPQVWKLHKNDGNQADQRDKRKQAIPQAARWPREPGAKMRGAKNQ